jgi:DNA invertase Pin-like site-specific DNA recombinase
LHKKFKSLKMPGKKIGYIRVSSIDQNPDRQLQGIQLDKVFMDKISGRSVAPRPQLQELLNYVRDGDIVIVHSLDRLARNLDDLRSVVKTLVDKEVTVQFIKENLTFTGNDSPMSHLLLSVFGAIAEFERGLIRERQKEGVQLAKERGAYKGRKPFSPEKIAQIKNKIAEGISFSRIARDLGIGRSTLYNYL